VTEPPQPPAGQRVTGDTTAPALSRDELKRRASAGVSIVATRTVAILIISVGGNVVVARLLTPHDFGVVAIGASFVMFASLVSDGGLGFGLIRRAEPPTHAELEALTGLQLAISLAVAIAAAAVAAAAPLGQVGWVTALMVSSMPIAILQFPGKIVLERSLSYRQLAAVEVGQVVTNQAWAVTFVALGFGVWGLASAAVAMRVVAALMMARVSPVGIPRPRLGWRSIRPLLGFGLRFQATSATLLLRDQGMNMSLAGISGVDILGLWSLVKRLLEIPSLLVGSLFRVSVPTMSQLVATKDRAIPRLIERAAGTTAFGSGLMLTGLTGASPGLFPGLFGEQWRGATIIVPSASLGLGIGSAISVAAGGYLYAVGDATAVLRATIFQVIAMFAVTLPLLPILGPASIGLGLLASSVAGAVELAYATRRQISINLVRPLIVPAVAGICAASLGWAVSDEAGADLVAGLAGGAISIGAFLILATALDRKTVTETFRLGLGSLRSATALGVGRPSKNAAADLANSTVSSVL
jgi:polysaccharide transporter, PST family